MPLHRQSTNGGLRLKPRITEFRCVDFLDASAFLVLVKGVAVVLAEDRADMGGGLIGQGWFKWAARTTRWAPFLGGTEDLHSEIRC